VTSSAAIVAPRSRIHSRVNDGASFKSGLLPERDTPALAYVIDGMTDTQLADRELEALLSLLGTESDRSLAVIVEQMRAFPVDRLQRLAELAATRGGPDDHLNLLLAERDSPRLQAQFLQWLAHGADLEEGALLVARVGYPLLDTQLVRDRLDQFAGEARNYCRCESPRDSLAALIHMVTREWRFQGDLDD